MQLNDPPKMVHCSTGEVIASALEEEEPSAVVYTDKIKKKFDSISNVEIKDNGLILDEESDEEDNLLEDY